MGKRSEGGIRRHIERRTFVLSLRNGSRNNVKNDENKIIITDFYSIEGTRNSKRISGRNDQERMNQNQQIIHDHISISSTQTRNKQKTICNRLPKIK